MLSARLGAQSYERHASRARSRAAAHPQSSRRPVVSAPSRTNGTPLVHARGRRHTPQREACRLGFDCLINVTILAKGKTIYQLVLRIKQ